MRLYQVYLGRIVVQNFEHQEEFIFKFKADPRRLSKLFRQPVSDLLKDLPSFNIDNFSMYNAENGSKISTKRPSVYIATADTSTSRLIVTDKTNILLRYLHLQWEKKNISRKRELTETQNAEDQRKRVRLDGGNADGN